MQPTCLCSVLLLLDVSTATHLEALPYLSLVDVVGERERNLEIHDNILQSRTIIIAIKFSVTNTCL